MPNIISDTKARRIASEWLEGTGPMTALATSGAIRPAVILEIQHCMNIVEGNLSQGRGSKIALKELRQLLRYVTIKGTRMPVKDWYKLNF